MVPVRLRSRRRRARHDPLRPGCRRGRAARRRWCSPTGSAAARSRSPTTPRDLAERGYVVLTYSARGFGRSTGQIGLNDPRYEIADLSTLLDLLAERDDVAPRRRRRPAGRRRRGLLRRRAGPARGRLRRPRRRDRAADHLELADHGPVPLAGRRGADAGTVAATPQDSGAGVYKKLWAGLFFGVGAAPTGGLLRSLGLGGGGDDGTANGDGAPQDPGPDPGAADAETVEQALTCGRFRLDICRPTRRRRPAARSRPRSPRCSTAAARPACSTASRHRPC